MLNDELKGAGTPHIHHSSFRIHHFIEEVLSHA
jgi:hypothetical protein